MKADEVVNENELRLLRQRLSDLEEETRSLREHGSRASARKFGRFVGRVPRAVVGVLAAVIIVATGLGTVSAANGDCPNGFPFCFSPKTPAKASQVNHNFSMIKEWVEQKVGTVGTTDVAVQSNLSVQGTATVGAVATAGNVAAATVTATGNIGAASVSATGTIGAASVSATGTVTTAHVDASGTVYAGQHMHTCTASAYDIQDCACPAGYQVLGGGAACQVGYLFESRPINATTWRVRCAFGENHDWPKTILGMTLICARVGN